MRCLKLYEGQVQIVIDALEIARMEYNKCTIEARKEGQERIAEQFKKQADGVCELLSALELIGA